MKKLKKRLSVLLCVALIMAMAIPVSAAYQKRVESCPRCRARNTSFGYEEICSWGSDTAVAGEYCEGCKKVVPEGERHTFLYPYSKYTFLCNSSKCSRLSYDNRIYEIKYKNEAKEHYTSINGVRRRDF